MRLRAGGGARRFWRRRGKFGRHGRPCPDPDGEILLTAIRHLRNAHEQGAPGSIDRVGKRPAIIAEQTDSHLPALAGGEATVAKKHEQRAFAESHIDVDDGSGLALYVK